MKYTEQILFVVSCGLIFFQAFGLSYDSYTNYKKGLLAVVFVIFVESLLKGEIIFFKRFSAFWRAILRVAFLYLCGLIFLAFQNEIDARAIVQHIYPECNEPIQSHELTYDDHCDLTWDNFKSDFDHYYAIHLFNWFMGTLIVRDRWMMHFWHVFDEIIELSFQHRYAHFAECWWDHLITDIFLSNIPAVEIALWLIKKLKWKQYDWFGKNGKTKISDWDIFYNHRRFGGFCQFIVVIVVNFLCGFFLINSLWIPPKNAFNIFRLVTWFLTSNMAFRELYTDIETWGTYERIKNPVSGKARWITLFLCIAESFVSIKFMKGAGNIDFEATTPAYIWVPWVVMILGGGLFYLYLRFFGARIQKYPLEYYQSKVDHNLNSVQAKEKTYLEEMHKNSTESYNKKEDAKAEEVIRNSPEKDKKKKKKQ